MRTTLPSWFLILVAQYFMTPVFPAPTRKGLLRGKDWNDGHVMMGSQSFKRTNAVKRKLTKLPSIVENPEKKSELKKKTTISINGRVLPIAGLSQTDKAVHVTIQNAAGQENQQTQSINGQTPQAVIQEVVPQNIVPAQATTFRSPPTSLQGLPQPPGQGLVGMAPPHTPTQLQNQGELGMSIPGQLGMSHPQLPGQEVTVQQIGMSPPARHPGQDLTSYPGRVIGMSPPQLPGQQLISAGDQGQLGLSPSAQLPGQTLTQLTTNPQVQNACNSATNTLQSGGKIVNLGTNSEGQLTYKPVRC